MGDISEKQTKEQPISAGSRPDIHRLQHMIVNNYLVGQPGSEEWAVVDAGLTKGCGEKIFRTAEMLFGSGKRPSAILLTHGHFDHVGAVEELARRWDVPVYAHALELPYLTGRSEYPPADPTVGGGLMARLARLYPNKPIDLGDRVRTLPGDGSVPGMPGWRWIHTPGHTPGHVSFFRDNDRALIAGDAFVTVKQESALAVLTHRQEVSRPPAYFTPDWSAARASVQALAGLEPDYAAAGHGIPMEGDLLRQELHALATQFDQMAVPAYGRYVGHPAMANEQGVISVPPPVPDPFPKVVLGVSVAAAALLTTMAIMCRSRKMA